MKKKIDNAIIEIPFWYHINKKIIRDFFENKILKIFRKEFLDWEEYKKKIKEIDEQSFKKS